MQTALYEGLFTDYYKDYTDGAINKTCYYSKRKLNGKLTGYYPKWYNKMLESNYHRRSNNR
ncbi:MAG: hypothetical protein QM800_07750 [Paludibacter sp.]